VQGKEVTGIPISLAKLSTCIALQQIGMMILLDKLVISPASCPPKVCQNSVDSSNVSLRGVQKERDVIGI
jgi:hypothetical protein